MNRQVRRGRGEGEGETGEGLRRALSPSFGGQRGLGTVRLADRVALPSPRRLSLFDFGRKIRCLGCFFISRPSLGSPPPWQRGLQSPCWLQICR